MKIILLIIVVVLNLIIFVKAAENQTKHNASITKNILKYDPEDKIPYQLF